MEKVFGIDLGTTYSCIAQIDESGKAVIIENSENDRITPSVVFFEPDSDNVVVGKTAKNALETDPDQVVAFIKREMGNPLSEPFEHNGKEHQPEMISSYILQKIVKDASEKLGTEVKKVVITCPAYFGNDERKATENAGKIAGLDVLAIINEPTAAAISYGIENQEDQTILVYDLGGGTFDVTIMKISSGKIEVVATGGDHELGGKNWDEVIINYFAKKFKEISGIEEDILEDSETLGDLQLKAETAKKDLSQKNKVKVRIMHGGIKENIELSKEEFEELTSHLFEQTIQLTNDTIENAKNKADGITKIDKILLVGGSTKMPKIKIILEENYSNTPIESYKPDEAVALGAAIYAQNIETYKELTKIATNQGVEVENLGDLKDKMADGTIDTTEIENSGLFLGAATDVVNEITEIVNVISRSYGIAALEGGADSEKKIYNLILKDTILPVKKEQQFGTSFKNQTSVLVELYENEYLDKSVALENGKLLIDGVIEGITPNLPENSPIQVSFNFDEQGILKVLVKELSSGKELRLEYQSDAVMSDKEVEEAIEIAGGITVI